MKRRFALLVIISILIIVNVSFFMVNKSQSCNKCQIEFKQTKTSGHNHEPIIYTYSPFELYDSLLNNSCVITWSRVGGYDANKQATFG